MSKSPVYKILKITAWFVLIVYMMLLTKIILFKRPLSTVAHYFKHQYSWQVVKNNAKQANLTPGTTISLYMNKEKRVEYSIINLAGNIVAFMPLGLLVPLLFRKTRRFWKITGISLLISLLFELTQLATALGSFDVDDLLLNTIGGILGYFVYLLFFYTPAKAPEKAIQ